LTAGRFHFFRAGVDLVRKALRIPCFTIASNAGVDAQEVVQRVIAEKFEIGYDAMNGVYVDMMKSGIIDPTKVSVVPIVVVVRM
jgi:chaperonin GroEL